MSNNKKRNVAKIKNRSIMNVDNYIDEENTLYAMRKNKGVKIAKLRNLADVKIVIERSLDQCKR